MGIPHTAGKLDLIARWCAKLGFSPNTVLFDHTKAFPDIEADWARLKAELSDQSDQSVAEAVARDWHECEVFTAFPTPWTGTSCECFFCDPEKFSMG